MKLNATVILLLICGSSFTYGQKIVRSSLNAFGNVVQNNEIRLSQTAGQASNHSILSNETSELRQGFQQANSSETLTKSKGLKLTVYPNPNNGTFSIAFEERIEGQLSYRLIDNQGRIYRDEKIIAHGNQFNYTLPSGSYILQVKSPEGRSGIAKIIILP